MSSLRFATPEALLGWLKKLTASHRVLAPRQEGPSTVFRPQTEADLTDIAALLRRATASPKGAILPHSETLVRFSATKDPDNPAKLDARLDVPDFVTNGAEPTVLFGGRPCDARGFVTLDRPYTQGPFKDPYYMARRAATVIITQACPTALPACFCNWVGSHPADPEGSDILFTAVDGGFALEAITDKGRELLDAAGLAEGDDRKAAVEAAHKAAVESLPPPSTLEDIPARVAARFTDEAFWIKQTAKCLSCGACTYLCPTCQCFTITDEGSPLDGRRIRSWDSCMSPQFTLETSGHNPREAKFKRMRNRIGHKFSYYPQTYDGAYSCVGCGRCVVSCPVSLDIRAVVRDAVEGASTAPAARAEGEPAPSKVSGKASSRGSKKAGKE